MITEIKIRMTFYLFFVKSHTQVKKEDQLLVIDGLEPAHEESLSTPFLK